MERFSDLILYEPLIKEEKEPDRFMNDFDKKNSIFSDKYFLKYECLIEFLHNVSTIDTRPLFIMGFIVLALEQILKKCKTKTYSDIQEKFTLKKELLVRDYALKLFFKTLNKKNQKELSDKIQDILKLYVKMNKKEYDCHIIYNTYKKIENQHHFKDDLYDIFYHLEK